MKSILNYVTFLAVLVAIGIGVWALPAASSPNEVAVDQSAKLAGRTSEVCVTNAAGGTATPTTGFQNRKAIELQNLGPNVIYCTVDGQAPLATGALGRKIDVGASWALDATQGIVVKCIAATAAQVSPACTQVTELR